MGKPEIKLKNMLIVVKNIEKSKQFYNDLFGVDVVLDNGGNVILTEGLVLQDRKIWESFLEKEVILRSNSTELYFEEYDLDAFVEKLERLYPRIQYVNKLMTLSWGQKVVRFYDPHTTTKRIPNIHYLQEERDLLLPLPDRRYRLKELESRIMEKALYALYGLHLLLPG